ncbi:hypothetical protein [Desulfosediminicola flagellatus]|uniref:hypothetical protein n=1 Tax=Desulfosediminicola flagellatus TaxID=2569541 RepID=UPI0010ACFF2B|nr:hypothetical protein [Desulfosediminicola flagellatus]
MDDMNNAIPELKLGYPRKPGFIMLSYEILDYLKRRFVFTGSLSEDLSGCFTVTLDGLMIYSNQCEEVPEIDREKIASVLCIYRLPVPLTEILETENSTAVEETDSDQWDECFCSGE